MFRHNLWLKIQEDKDGFKQMMRTAALESEGLYPQTKKPEPSLRNLALGILLQAFRDIVAPKKASNKEWEEWRQDALEWFYSHENQPGSFFWVCEVLEMNPNDLRNWLQEYLLLPGWF